MRPSDFDFDIVVAWVTLGAMLICLAGLIAFTTK